MQATFMIGATGPSVPASGSGNMMTPAPALPVAPASPLPVGDPPAPVMSPPLDPAVPVTTGSCDPPFPLPLPAPFDPVPPGTVGCPQPIAGQTKSAAMRAATKEDGRCRR